MRGDVHLIRFTGTGHEQQGQRYAVIVQASGFDLSTTLVCPTSPSARPAILHPTAVWDAEGTKTQVLTEQLRAVDNNVLGPMVGHLLHDEMERITEAIGIILEL